MPRMPRHRRGLLVALFLCALALRPQLVGVGPLLPRVERGLSVSHAVAGLLETIPVLCMGLFAPFAAYVLHGVGTRHAIALSVGLLAVTGIARAFVPSAAAVLLLTVPVGIGIALAGTMLPVAVKETFADHPAFATGVYATGLNAGSALSSALAVPLAVVAGGWRGAFALFAALSLAMLVAWLGLTRGEATHERPPLRPPRLPLRSGTAWALVLLFAVQGCVFYGLNAWLPDAYVEHGWSQSHAGALLGVVNLTSIPIALTVPFFADRFGARRHYLLACSVCFLLGVLGLVAAPGVAWPAAVVTGVGIGGLFPLVLTLPLDVADNPADVGALAGLMLGGGYAIAALSPLALGALRDLSGGFEVPLWTTFALAVLTAAACIPFSRERLGQRHGPPDPATVGYEPAARRAAR
jgi:MFS transporter, CP family, cyanate transporter